MRIIVMSDSHTSYPRVARVVEDNLDADLFLHLGDGEEEFWEVAALYPNKKFVGVRGNNDWSSTQKAIEFLDCQGVRIMMTHGDAYSVKWSLARLESEAAKQNVQVALYGHTHVARSEYINGRWFINPGSVLDSRITPAGYLALDITKAGIVPVLRTIEPSPEEYL